MKTLFIIILASSIFSVNDSTANQCTDLAKPGSGTWKILADHSNGYVEFQNTWKTTHEGKVKINKGEITFSETSIPQAFQLDLSIEDVWNRKTTRQVEFDSPEYLDASTHPSISFQSDEIKFHAEQKVYYAFGTIVMKGKQLPMALPFELVGFDEVEGERQAIFEVSFKLDRTDFGVGNENEKLGEVLNFNLSLRASQTDLPKMEVGTPEVK